jgi:hypothetical protein
MQLKKTELLVIGSILFVCLLVIYFGISMSPRDTSNVKAIQKKHKQKFASTVRDVDSKHDDTIIKSDIDDINQLMIDSNEMNKENKCIRSIVDQCDVNEDGTRDCEHLVCCGKTKDNKLIYFGNQCDSDGMDRFRKWSDKCPTEDKNNNCTPLQVCSGTCSQMNPLFHVHHVDLHLRGPGAGYSSGH